MNSGTQEIRNQGLGRSYMKAEGVEDGLLLNFATMPLTIKRVGRELRKTEE